MTKALYLKNPESSQLGRHILQESLELINQIGFEAFTFKKLALQCKTTEATVYRYFKNKHYLLLYMVNQYWTQLYTLAFYICQTEQNPKKQILHILNVLLNHSAAPQKSNPALELNALYQLVLWEGSKTYLTRNVDQYNKDYFFKPLKDLSLLLANAIKAHNPKTRFPKSLASTVLEMVHLQRFYSDHLPSLTDVQKNNPKTIKNYLMHILQVL